MVAWNEYETTCNLYKDVAVKNKIVAIILTLHPFLAQHDGQST